MRYFLAFWSIIWFSAMHGQTIVRDYAKQNEYNLIHKEEVFVHQSASLLFVGEKLYYRMYCLDSEKGNLSPISKVGYVELVGPDKINVFKHKIRLTSGLGNGDFFIPTNLPTGNYKLLGYTHWMKNNGKNKYFLGDVNIVNLYRTDKNSLAEKDSLRTDTPRIDTVKTGEDLWNNTKVYPKNLRLTLSKEKYGPREKVSLAISTISGTAPYGNYSLSIRQKDELINASTPKTITSFFEKTAVPITSNSDTIFLPELRGELIFGKVVSKKPGVPVANIKVGLSIPGKDFIFKIANSNANGDFYFNLNEHYDNETAIIQILGDDRNDYTAVLQENSIDYSDLKFDKLAFKKGMKDYISSRNVHSQIQNAFLAAKQDRVEPINSDFPFYRNFSIVYDLDDFTRFPTIRETLVEVIDNVWIRKDKNGDFFFQVRGNEFFTSSDFLPLVIVDGIMIQDHSDLLNIDARSIKKINILRNKYEFGLQTYQGILAFETFEGNFESLVNNDFLQKIALIPPLPQRNYFKASYGAETQIKTDRIPDYRYQLLWLPELRLNENNTTIEFFTSDVTGTFEVFLEGFTIDGKPTSIFKTFDVE